MNKDENKLIELAANIELKLSNLYNLISNKYKEDFNFWHTLSMEEQHHFSIVESIPKFCDILPYTEELLFKNIKEIKRTLEKIDNLTENIENNIIEEKHIFKQTYEIENMSSESHFQMLIDQENNNKLYNLIKILNGDDKDHAKRIKNKYKAKYNQDIN